MVDFLRLSFSCLLIMWLANMRKRSLLNGDASADKHAAGTGPWPLFVLFDSTRKSPRATKSGGQKHHDGWKRAVTSITQER